MFEQVALQIEDGSRKQGAFSCSTSLWQVLLNFEDLFGTRLTSDERGNLPCVSFMNAKKMEGKELLETTQLLHLGVVSGSALLKHSFNSSPPAPEAEEREALEALDAAFEDSEKQAPSAVVSAVVKQ